MMTLARVEKDMKNRKSLAKPIRVRGSKRTGTGAICTN